MKLLEIIVVLLVFIGIFLLIRWFIKQSKTPEEINRRQKRKEKKKRRKNYADIFNAQIQAEENAAKGKFLANPQPYNLIGENSNAYRFGKHLLGK